MARGSASTSEARRVPPFRACLRSPGVGDLALRYGVIDASYVERAEPWPDGEDRGQPRRYSCGLRDEEPHQEGAARIGRGANRPRHAGSRKANMRMPAQVFARARYQWELGCGHGGAHAHDGKHRDTANDAARQRSEAGNRESGRRHILSQHTAQRCPASARPAGALTPCCHIRRRSLGPQALAAQSVSQ